MAANLYILTLEGHSGWVYCLKELQSGLIVSGSSDKTIKVWEPLEYESNTIL